MKDYAILCEGKDAELFLISYLNSKELKTDQRFSNDIQVFNFGGNEELNMYLRTFKNVDGFSKIHKLLIIRDAEQDADKAQSMIQTALKNCGLPVPEKPNCWTSGGHPNTAYTLFPTCSDSPMNGTLEDLCWNILAEDDIASQHETILEFIDEVKQRFNSIRTYEHKCRLHTYFSTNDRFVSLKIGEAANAGAFDWSDSHLTQLRELIAEGLSSDITL